MLRILPFSLFALAACGTPEPTDSAAEHANDTASVVSSVPRSSAPDDLRAHLSGEARDAYDVLARTRRFTDAAIYDGGVTPREVIALRILAREPEAAALFRALLASDSMGTRLYALCGLYYADPNAFAAGVEGLRGTTATLEFQTGCESLTDYPVAMLLDAGAERAVRLDSRAQTIRAWKLQDEARHALGYDVVGGGFPDLFRTGGGYGELRAERLAEGAD